MKTQDSRKIVTFRLADAHFAADVAEVERVLRYDPPAAAPDLPPWVEGVMAYRKQIIPVIDLRRRVGLPEREPTPETRILVLNTSAGWVGAVVDAVMEVASVPRGEVSDPPPLFRGLAAEFIRGVAKMGETLVVVLNADRVLTSADQIALEAARSAAVEAALSG